MKRRQLKEKRDIVLKFLYKNLITVNVTVTNTKEPNIRSLKYIKQNHFEKQREYRQLYSNRNVNIPPSAIQQKTLVRPVISGRTEVKGKCT